MKKKRLIYILIFFLIIPISFSLSFSPKEEVPNRPYELNSLTENQIINVNGSYKVNAFTRTWSIHKPSSTWYKDYIAIHWLVGGGLGFPNNTALMNFYCLHLEENETTNIINFNYTSALTEKQTKLVKVPRSQNTLLCKQTVFLNESEDLEDEKGKDLNRYFPVVFLFTNYKGEGCSEIEDEILLTDASKIEGSQQDYTTFMDYIIKIVYFNFELLVTLYWIFKIGVLIFAFFVPILLLYFFYGQIQKVVGKK